jgi:hypothetical protein
VGEEFRWFGRTPVTEFSKDIVQLGALTIAQDGMPSGPESTSPTPQQVSTSLEYTENIA